MSLEAEINAYFVQTKPNGTDNEDFITAAAILSSHVPERSIRHIKANDGFPLIASGQLTKRDVFIFDYFEGDFFKQLQTTKSLIIGPRCLAVCLLRNEQIPLGKSPVYTTAMRDLKISASGVTPQEKDELSVKIQWMGGYYFQNFGRQVTHLVSNTIKSSKYEYATLNGIPVMHVDWVQSVWERSLKENIMATDEDFDKYRLPIFFGVNFTSTGLSTEKKDEVIRLVQENGGTYHRAFRSQSVDIVITEKGKTDSDKYQAAIRFKKDVLAAEWIFDSVQKGFALPTKDYQVKSLKVSTPTKPDQSVADFTATDQTNLSDISRISSIGSNKRNNDVTVNDTICSAMNDSHFNKNDGKFLQPEPIAAPPKESTKNLQRDILRKTVESSAQYRNVLEEISPREAKKAGNFLDGFCIYLSGFRSNEKEKLNRILNSGGATRFDAINDEITHIIVGNVNDIDSKGWKKDGLRSSVHIVRLDWLLESIKQKQAANENMYRVVSLLSTRREPDAPSPSSKKTLRSMNHSFKQPEAPPKKKLFDVNSEDTMENYSMPTESNMPLPRASSTEMPMEEDEHELLAQYSQENLNAHCAVPPPKPTPSAAAASSAPSQPAPASAPAAANGTEMTAFTIDYDALNVFENLVFYVHRNFAEEFYTQLQKECEAAQANIIGENFQDVVDYAVVSFERTFDISELPVKAKYVVTDLYVESCMKENKIVPIEYYHKPIPHTANRQPLQDITIVISCYSDLEREYISSLAKVMGANVNSAYMKKEQPLLICPVAEGAKYLGALKWRFPVVTSAWLVKCAEEGNKIPLRPYLVGESAENFPAPSSTSISKKSIIDNGTPAAPIAVVTPLRNRRVSELLENLKSTPTNNSTPTNSGNPPTTTTTNTPHTPANNGAYSIHFMEEILLTVEDASDRECLREIIEDIRANPTPELERIKRQVCTPINRRFSYTPKTISDFCNTPEFKRRMVEEFEKRFYLPTKKLKPSTPLDQIRKRVLRETCKNLGIPLSDEENDDNELNSSHTTNRGATPIIVNNRFGNTSNATNAQVTPMQQRTSSRFTGPRSLFSGQTPSAENRSIHDNIYVPNTQDETHKRSSEGDADIRRPSLVGKSTIDFDKISFDETTIARKSAIAKNSPKIDEYLRERELRRESLRKKQEEEENEEKLPEGIALVVQMGTENFCLDSEGLVEWTDPIEFNREKGKNNSRTMQYDGTPRFSISCSDETKLDDVISKIYQLGGKVSEDLVHFDPDCTHFVCERPNRGEKILGCISSGKWVLSLKYIEECFAKDNFINEELYEWGNSKAVNIPEISDDDHVVARAAHFWRKKLSESGTPGNAGIFTGIKAILRIGQRTIESMSNVVKAGRGETIAATSPYSKCPGASSATHCFVDVKKMPLQKEDYDFLKKNGVKIASHLYIQAFIFNGADVDISAFEIKM